MRGKEFVAYSGERYTIEWYFDPNGLSQPLDYFYAMSNSQKRKLLMLFKRMGDFGRISDKTKFRNENDGIYAFKPQPDRFLSFFTSNKKIIVTEGFIKKSNKLPKSIKDRSLRIESDYLERVKEGSYYE
jgi:phage-related protein